MNLVARFFIEFAESRRIEGQLKRKLSELEIKGSSCSSKELEEQVSELDDLAYFALGFNKGLLFTKGKSPYSVNLINFEIYKERIGLLKDNLGYKQNHQNI
jgi:hypothetical protein